MTYSINSGIKDGIRTRISLNCTLTTDLTDNNDKIIGTIPAAYAPLANATSWMINGYSIIAVFVNASGDIHARCISGSVHTINCTIIW